MWMCEPEAVNNGVRINFNSTGDPSQRRMRGPEGRKKGNPQNTSLVQGVEGRVIARPLGKAVSKLP